MKKNRYHVFIISVVLMLLCFSCTEENLQNDLASRTKIALRGVGDALLLSQNDSTSLVMPIVQVSENTYHLSFENSFTFDPTDLYAAMSENSKKAGLPQSYSIEVLRCSDGEVGYSYLLTGEQLQDIIPCGGRILPDNCYTVVFKYLKAPVIAGSQRNPWFYVLVSLVFAFLVLVFYSKYHAHRIEVSTTNATRLGDFYFYPDQNKLVKAATEIPLSKKECELLEILVASTNQVVKRESLEKQVWEDQGVIVGRSLDTYISKLRKKLQSDDTLKITNVHGVGYKLETVG